MKRARIEVSGHKEKEERHSDDVKRRKGKTLIAIADEYLNGNKRLKTF